MEGLCRFLLCQNVHFCFEPSKFPAVFTPFNSVAVEVNSGRNKRRYYQSVAFKMDLKKYPKERRIVGPKGQVRPSLFPRQGGGRSNLMTSRFPPSQERHQNSSWYPLNSLPPGHLSSLKGASSPLVLRSSVLSLSYSSALSLRTSSVFPSCTSSGHSMAWVSARDIRL